jgi:Fur family ferric uptake transcriptional regulator
VKTADARSPWGRASKGPDVERLRADLDRYMLKRGLRYTDQRRLIIDAFFEQTEHITVDELYGKVRGLDARIGHATVYRTMKMLVDGGVVQAHEFGDGFTRYELADDHAHHDHLICLECGNITEFEEPIIEQLQERVAARYGFLVKAHKHELYGVCKQCYKRRKKR